MSRKLKKLIGYFTLSFVMLPLSNTVLIAQKLHWIWEYIQHFFFWKRLKWVKLMNESSIKFCLRCTVIFFIYLSQSFCRPMGRNSAGETFSVFNLSIPASLFAALAVTVGAHMRRFWGSLFCWEYSSISSNTGWEKKQENYPLYWSFSLNT